MAMGGMIERISTMIREMDGESRDWRHYADDAFAIVRDMYEPTAAMLLAAEGKSGGAAWRAMIDVVLAKKVFQL